VAFVLHTGSGAAASRGEEVPTMPALLVSGLIVLAVGVGLALSVWGVYVALPAVNRLVTRAFWCPFRRRDVSVDLAERAWDARLVDVTRCSAFEPASAITCDKACLGLGTLEPPHHPETTGAAPVVAERR
jgi:hypothetical protein